MWRLKPLIKHRPKYRNIREDRRWRGIVVAAVIGASPLLGVLPAAADEPVMGLETEKSSLTWEDKAYFGHSWVEYQVELELRDEGDVASLEVESLSPDFKALLEEKLAGEHCSVFTEDYLHDLEQELLDALKQSSVEKVHVVVVSCRLQKRLAGKRKAPDVERKAVPPKVQ